MSKPSPDSAAAAATSAHQGGSSETAVPRSGADPGVVDSAGAWMSSGPMVWTTEARDALSVAFRATLQRGVHGL